MQYDSSCLSDCQFLNLGIYKLLPFFIFLITQTYTGIVMLNPKAGMNVHLLCLLCVEKAVFCALDWSLIYRSSTACVWVCVSIYVWSSNLNNEVV